MMTRPFVLLSVVCFAAALVGNTNAYTSTFTGKSFVMSPQATATTTNQSSRGVITMKKGKSNVPPNMRSQYKRQQELSGMREQMEAAQKPGPDGFPVFNLFVRTKRANMWYPCGSFKGDDRSNSLAQSFRDGGLLAGLAKKQLDGGVSGSLFTDIEKLKETICRAYPQLKKSRNDLEFGYKLAFGGLSKEQEAMNNITPEEQKGPIDTLKRELFGNGVPEST